MYDYVIEELPSVVRQHFPVNGRESISGHSMGGHGALILALRHPGRFRSVSAFSPVVNPMNSPWGQQAFTAYLGEDQSRWRQYDACELVANGASRQRLFIDQGEADHDIDVGRTQFAH